MTYGCAKRLGKAGGASGHGSPLGTNKKARRLAGFFGLYFYFNSISKIFRQQNSALAVTTAARAGNRAHAQIATLRRGRKLTV